MACRTLAVLLLLVANASAVEEDAWGPPESITALDSVVNAVTQIVSNAKTADSLKRAQILSANVKADIEAVEAGNLSKAEAHEKVGQAIKELTGFEMELNKAHPEASEKAAKIAKLEKELAEKKEELAKDENMIKLIKMKKDLAEKKLRLQGLLDQKENSDKNIQADQDEAAKTNQWLKGLVAMANENSTVALHAKEEQVPSSLKTILASVETRRQSVAQDLNKMETEEKTSEGKIDAILQKQGGADAKSQGMLKRLKKEEHRKFAKAQAVKRIELNELKDAEASIESRDVSGLQKVLSKIETEGKALQVKGGFLY